MAKTVVGFFDTYDQARGAHDELVRQGIDGGQISLISNRQTQPAADLVTEETGDAALVDIGVPQEDARLYQEGVRRGGTLLILRASDTKSARRAANTMNQFGAQDIKRRSGQWESAGQTKYAAPPTSPGAAAGGISPPHPGEEQHEGREAKSNERRIPVNAPGSGNQEGPVTVVEEFISITKDPANRADLSRDREHGEESPPPAHEDGEQ